MCWLTNHLHPAYNKPPKSPDAASIKKQLNSQTEFRMLPSYSFFISKGNINQQKPATHSKLSIQERTKEKMHLQEIKKKGTFTPATLSSFPKTTEGIFQPLQTGPTVFKNHPIPHFSNIPKEKGGCLPGTFAAII